MQSEEVRLEALKQSVLASGRVPPTDGVIVARAARFENYIRTGDDKTYPYVDGDFIILGPECFADRRHLIISYQGDRFYRACGNLVTKQSGGGATYCAKRVNHPSNVHEDYDGNTSEYVRLNS